jgi:GR25 family glycosyltransferase involved in LPS biosynthesis
MDKRDDLWNSPSLTLFRNNWNKQNKTWHRMPGVDYTNETNVINKMILSNRLNLNGSGFRKDRAAFLGELGCYMGHYNCWKYVIENKLDSCLILEDGVSFLTDDLKNIKIEPKLDILFVNEEMQMNANKQFIGYGTQGYIVTSKGAKLLMEQCHVLSLPIDLQIRHLCNNHTVVADILSTPLVKRNNNRISSIQTDLLVDCNNLNDKQEPSSIIQRIITKMITKINLDEYI